MDQLVDEDVAFYGTANEGAILCGIDGGVRRQKDVGRIHHGRALEAELVLAVEAVTGFGAEQNLGVGLVAVVSNFSLIPGFLRRALSILIEGSSSVIQILPVKLSVWNTFSTPPCRMLSRHE